jgi:catalase-peroxidase
MPDKEHTRSVSESGNPVIPSPAPKTSRPRTNKNWWPNQLDLSVLHHHSHLSNPMQEDFNYAEEFKSLDLEALKRDLVPLRKSQSYGTPRDVV